MAQTVKDYLAKDYAVGFKHDANSYFVEVLGCKGCMSQGDTLEEACYMIVDAFTGWLEVGLEDGDTIPEPEYIKPVFWDDYTALILLRFVRKIAQIWEVHT